INKSNYVTLLTEFEGKKEGENFWQEVEILKVLHPKLFSTITQNIRHLEVNNIRWPQFIKESIVVLNGSGEINKYKKGAPLLLAIKKKEAVRYIDALTFIAEEYEPLDYYVSFGTKVKGTCKLTKKLDAYQLFIRKKSLEKTFFDSKSDVNTMKLVE